MSGETATAKPWSGALPWASVTTFLFLAAWIQNRMVAIVVSHQAREIPFPAATDLAVNTAEFLYLGAGLPLLLGLMSRHVGMLRRAGGPMFVMSAGFVLHLLFAYFLMLPPTVLAAGGAPRRLPDSARNILLHTDRIELYAVTSESSGNRSEMFHGHPIQARTDLSGAAAQTTGDKFVKSFSTNSSTVMMCFDPGYGMRAFHGKKSADFLLCYACNRVLVIHDGKQSEIALPPDTRPVIAKHFSKP